MEDKELLDRLSSMQNDITDKIEVVGDKIDTRINSLEDDFNGKMDNCHGAVASLTTETSTLNAKFLTTQDTVDNHQNVLFNGGKGGLVTEFNVLKTRVAIYVAVIASAGGIISSLATKLIGEWISTASP